MTPQTTETNPHLENWAERLKVKPDRKVIADTLAQLYPNADVLACDVCDFPVPDCPQVPSCPGCGAAFEVDDGSPEVEVLPPEAKAETPKSNGKVIDVPAQEEAPKAEKPKKEKKGRGQTRAEREEAKAAKAAKAAEEKPEKPSKPKKEKTPKAAAVATTETAEPAMDPKTAEKALKELAKREKRIDSLKSQSNQSKWEIGKELSEIYRRNLWQASGESAYRSFRDYCVKRFEFTPQTAMSFLLIAESFTKDEAGQIAMGAMRLLVKVPDEDDRKNLAAEAGQLTQRELAEKVRTLREEAGLNTSRAGHEGTVGISVRLKPGVIAEGSWTEKRKKTTAEFEIGGKKFVMEDHDNSTWTLRLVG